MNPMTEALNDIGLLIALPIGITVYFFKRWWDRSRMRQGLARILHTELSVNRDIVMQYRANGLSRALPAHDDVYRGLLASGNIQYLSTYQHALYSLYSPMVYDHEHQSKLLGAVLSDLAEIADCPFGKMCRLDPIPQIKRVGKAVRRKKGRRG